MITIQLADSRPGFSEGIACKEDAILTKVPTSPITEEFCICFFDCDYEEPVFYSDDGDEYKNDKTAFLFNLADSASTFEIKIVDPNGVETVMNDDTYGTFFDAGFNTEQPLKFGYLVDWKAVFDDLGLHGNYSVKVTITDFGTPIESESRTFKLMKFNEEIADGTVKIETTSEGVIQGGEDYRGMSWYQSIRIRGVLNAWTPNYEEENGTDNFNRPIQIEDRLFIDYNLEVYAVESPIYKKVIQDLMLSNVILISDYNLFSPEKNEETKGIRQVEITPRSVETGDDYSRTRRRTFIIPVRVKDPFIKRNYS